LEKTFKIESNHKTNSVSPVPKKLFQTPKLSSQEFRTWSRFTIYYKILKKPHNN